MNKTLQTIGRRWAASTPSFFRGLQRLGIILASSGAVVVTVRANYEQYDHLFPAWTDNAAGYLIVGGLIMAGIAKMTVSDPADLDKPVSQILEEKKTKNL